MNMREKILLVAIFMGAFSYSGNFVSWFKAWELGAQKVLERVQWERSVEGGGDESGLKQAGELVEKSQT